MFSGSKLYEIGIPSPPSSVLTYLITEFWLLCDFDFIDGKDTWDIDNDFISEFLGLKEVVFV